VNGTNPPVPNTLISDGGLGLSTGRFDERQRCQRLCLPDAATCWDYASLIDVVLRDGDSDAFRFTGKTAAQWMAELRKHGGSEYERFRRGYESTVNRHLASLARRPREPDNHYCVELAAPPLHSSLPGLIRLTGLMRASAAQWSATLRSLTSRGLKPEELEMSGVLARLCRMPGANILMQAQVLQMIDLSQVVPKFACESRFDFIVRSGWKEGCHRIPEKEYRRRRLLGKGTDARHLIRFRHRSLGWAVVNTRYSDLVTERTFWWSVLDEKGRLIDQPVPGFPDAEEAMAYAEIQMNRTFARWGKDQALAKWERYSLPGGDNYREILLQLDDWPSTYKPRHYRTRNVLVHIRTSVRHTQEGRRVLFLDEIQSDWHADLHTEASGESRGARRPPAPMAPFRKEWPLLSMKLMIWWAQRLGVEGLAWTSAELQLARWKKSGPPEILYRKMLPEAARSLATTLSLPFEQTVLSVRNGKRRVALGRHGWEVRSSDNVPVTKAFRTRAQAEHFADLVGEFFVIDVPVLWISQLQPIRSIPLYGVGRREAWLASDSDR
jgi:hypothetical protein